MYLSSSVTNCPRKKILPKKKKVGKNVDIFMARLHSKIHLKINFFLEIHLAQQRESPKMKFKILPTDTTLLLTFSAIYRNSSRLSF